MSRSIRFRPLARLELHDAMAWYDGRKAGLGMELKGEIDAILVRACENPGRFRTIRGEVRRALLRRFPFAIHFVAEPDAITVLAVFHTKRDPRHLEGRS